MTWLYKAEIWWKRKILLYVYRWYKDISEESKTRFDTSKSFDICATQLAGDLLLKMLKYFEVMWNVFAFSHVKNIAESWLVYGNNFHE